MGCAVFLPLIFPTLHYPVMPCSAMSSSTKSTNLAPYFQSLFMSLISSKSLHFHANGITNHLMINTAQFNSIPFYYITSANYIEEAGPFETEKNKSGPLRKVSAPHRPADCID